VKTNINVRKTYRIIATPIRIIIIITIIQKLSPPIIVDLESLKFGTNLFLIWLMVAVRFDCVRKDDRRINNHIKSVSISLGSVLIVEHISVHNELLFDIGS